MQTLWQDLRYGVRMLLKKPGFALIAILTLALGIGVNTAIFSVADAVLFRPLPFAEPDRLVELWQVQPGGQRVYPGLRRDAFQEWRGQADIFERVEAWDNRNFTLTGGGEPETVGAPGVSPGLFPLLGVSPRLGRLFQPDDAEEGNNRVVLISEELWQRHFGASPEALGKPLTLNDQAYTVVGVMPQGFKFPYGKFQLWVPLSLNPPAAEKRVWFSAVARLRNDVTLAGAQARLETIAQQLGKEKPDPQGWGVKLRRLDERRVNPEPRRALLVLLGAVAFVLLLACVNVANLLLSRAATRRGEIAVRLALGAGRLRVVRQLLTESLLLALLGGFCGVVLALWGVDLLRGRIPEELTFLSVNEIGFDLRVLLFTLGVSALTGILFGLIPALRLSRTELQHTLKGAGSSATADRTHNRLRGALVVAEVGLSLVLLVGAGLMIRSFLRLSSVHPGFEARNLVAATLTLPQQRYPTPAHVQDFYNRLKTNLANVPGVESVTVAEGVPPRGGGITFGFQMEIEGRPPEPSDPNLVLPFSQVERNYFQVMRIPLLAGRAFGPEDTPDARPVVIINDEMARRYWPGQDPVGKRFRLDSKAKWLTVAGVAGDVKVEGLNERFGKMEFYYPQSQDKSRGFQRAVIVRTRAEASAMIPAIKSSIWALDRDQPIYRINTVETLLSESMAESRFYLLLMSVFAGVALLLVSSGLYSVVAYLVSQRTHEIGIRMALGAQARDVLKLVMKQGISLALLGVALGLSGAFALTRLMRGLLFSISPTDPLTFVLIALLLVSVALLACWIPARRAARVDPMVALRCE